LANFEKAFTLLVESGDTDVAKSSLQVIRQREDLVLGAVSLLGLDYLAEGVLAVFAHATAAPGPISCACWTTNFEVLIWQDRQSVRKDDDASDLKGSMNERRVDVGFPEAQVCMVDP
jgi:hypothetical protein